ncbi:MAG: glycoside hydrolase family 27 protein [Kiritimatiellia bacterium]
MIVQTPPMGWNTWNTFGEHINEQLIRESVDIFVKLGLREAGYRYVVIDDCWSERERDPKTDEILPSKEKFPNGMKAVADYVHEKGLKFGMYSCAGVRTCANYPGSFGHEFLDAKTFARWGVDFLKYDYCLKAFSDKAPYLYRRMGQALRTCGRDILFSACNWGTEDVWSWIRTTGASMYRSTGDIFDNFQSMKNIAMGQLPKMCFSAPNCFNDMDMLTVGMFGNGNVGSSGCTYEEYVMQFSAWCLWGAPIMLGCDLRKMTPEIAKLVTNRDLIAINQDPLVAQPYCIEPGAMGSDLVTVARILEGGDLAVGLFNFSENDRWTTILLEWLGLPYESKLRLEMHDLLSGETTMSGRDEFSVPIPKHSVRMYRCKLVPAV